MKRVRKAKYGYPERRLAVSRRFVEYKGQVNGVVPSIIISGKWLEELGFKPSQRIDVCTAKGRLEIRIVRALPKELYLVNMASG